MDILIKLAQIIIIFHWVILIILGLLIQLSHKELLKYFFDIMFYFRKVSKHLFFSG